MMISYIIGLEPLADSYLEIWPGKALHAIFLRLIESQNPVMSDILHTRDEIKPFSVSGIQGPAVKHLGGRINFTGGARCWFRFTSLHRDLSRVTDDIVAALPPELDLHGCRFKVTGALSGHPLARRLAYDELTNDGLHGPGRVSPAIDLTFFTPTSFSQTDGPEIVFPLPANVFDSLFRKWNAFAAVKLKADLKPWVAAHVAVCRHKVYTRHIKIKKIITPKGEVKLFGFTGFVGSCRYLVKGKDWYMLRLLHLLADFSFYAGVGGHTAYGLGQTAPGWEDGKRQPPNSIKKVEVSL